MDTALTVIGGLALFLLGMRMLTEGLKIVGGRGLRVLLERWTATPMRGVFSGMLLTALVQSSGAVTVATIGFVNAGAMTLTRALAVVFGANVGTTFTGWLVSLTGLGFRIEPLAMPIVAAGVALGLTAKDRQRRGVGDAVTGLGLFFLALAFLKTAFSGVTASLDTSGWSGEGVGGVLAFLLLGTVVAALTQSSSATIALILTAVSQSALGLQAGAAGIIGANIGTTMTATVAAVNATPNAKRVAAGHVVFNVGTGIVALLILPLMLRVIHDFDRLTGLGEQAVVTLAMFNSALNVLGVVLMLPFLGMLSRRLERYFATAEEDLGRPRHLDNTLAATPTLALPAMERELERMRDQVSGIALAALSGAETRGLVLERRSEAVLQLGEAVTEYATTVRMEGMSKEMAEQLPRLVRIGRYLDEAVRLAPDAGLVRGRLPRLRDAEAKATLEALLGAAAATFAIGAEAGPEAFPGVEAEQKLARFEEIYQEGKGALLHATVAHHLSIDGADELLDAISRTRRMVQQFVKATRMLQGEMTTLKETDAA